MLTKSLEIRKQNTNINKFTFYQNDWGLKNQPVDYIGYILLDFGKRIYNVMYIYIIRI